MSVSSTSFKPGHAPLPGCGRPAGSRSGNTILRDYFRGASIDLFPDFLFALQQLKNDGEWAKFAEYYLKLTERVIPKISSLQFEQDGQTSTAMDHLRIVASWDKAAPEPPFVARDRKKKDDDTEE